MNEEEKENLITMLQTLQPDKELLIFFHADDADVESVKEAQLVLSQNFPDLKFLIMSDSWRVESFSLEDLMVKVKQEEEE